MTGGIEYKLWLDNQPVDATFYTMIETITVEQGIDLADAGPAPATQDRLPRGRRP